MSAMKIKIKERVIEMYLIKHILVFLIFVISTNTIYSQEMKCNSILSHLLNVVLEDNLPKDFSNDTIFYLYVDSNTVNGLTYIDSIKVDVLYKNINDNCIFVSGDGMILESDGFPFYIIHYPIFLKDNPLFKQAVYHGDCGLVSYITLCFQQKYMTLEGERKKYCILSSDGKYVNYAFLGEMDGDLYIKYNPFSEDNSSTITTIKSKKFRPWITQELEKNKNKVFSVIKNGKIYIVKLFNN